MESLREAIKALDSIIQNAENALSAASASAVADEANGPSIADKPSASSEDASAANGAAKQSGKSKKGKKDKSAKASASAGAADPATTQFLMADLRVGLISSVAPHPEAAGLYHLSVSYANGEVRSVCAGFRDFVSAEELSERSVVTVCNLKPRSLKGVQSEAMILAGVVRKTNASGEEVKVNVVPIVPPEGAMPGDIVRVEGIEGERDVEEGKYISSKNWTRVGDRLGVLGGVAMYDGKRIMVGDGPVRCNLPDGTVIS